MLKRLRKNVDVQLALQSGVGSVLAAKVVDAVRRTKLGMVRADGTLIRTAKSGRVYHPPRSARAPQSTGFVHARNAAHIRRAALIFAWIVSWLGPQGRTGHRAQGHRLRVEVLAEKAGCSVREVERYLAIWRSAGVLTAWQPPSSSGNAKGKHSGHCFNLYELAEVPPELERCLAVFHRAWWPRRSRAPVTAPAPGAPLDAAAIVQALRARKAPS